MLKLITIGMAIWSVTFGVMSAHADSLPIINETADDKYIAAIKKAYPASDERHKFAVALNQAGGLLTASTKGDFFVVSRIFSIVGPFLESNNRKIKLCAEDMIRFVKLGFHLYLLTQPPDDASCEEVRCAMEKFTKANHQMMASYSDFLLSTLQV